MLFKQVIDRFEVKICGADYTNQLNWIILNDGTVWFWDRWFSAYEPIFFIGASLLISLIAGIISGFVLMMQKRNFGPYANY